MTIKNVSYELLDETDSTKKTDSTTDVLLTFEHQGINKERYSLIKDELENYKLELNSECNTTIKSKYDESKHQLSIKLIILIPDHIFDNNIHKNVNLVQIINKQAYDFIKFYEEIRC